MTGEGRFDEQSLGGKVVGHVLELARARHLPGLVAGVLGSDPPPPVRHRLALSDIAGGPQQAISAARRWLMASGALLAKSVSG